MRDYQKGLSIERLKEALDFDPDTGQFAWRFRKVREGHFHRTDLAFNAQFGGKAVKNNISREGYVRIRVDNMLFAGHRLAWFYMTGKWPEDEIDHVNLVRNDNRWCNLRKASRYQNMANRPAHGDSATGIKGIHHVRKCDRYAAQICVGGRRLYLGSFESAEEAGAAYAAASQKYFGKFARAS